MSLQRVPVTVIKLTDEEYAAMDRGEFAGPLHAPLSFDGLITVVPEDMVDVALRQAKTVEEFDSVYAYSGRPFVQLKDRWRRNREVEDWVDSLVATYEEEASQ